MAGDTADSLAPPSPTHPAASASLGPPVPRSPSPPPPHQREGQVTFTVGDAFYRPQSALARDLAVLVATLERQRLGHWRVLDAMTGSGVRPLRYLLEAGADWVWANEGNPDLADTLNTNLAPVDATRYRLTHEDAQAVFFRCYQERDFYDLVDIDNFGRPSPHTSNALWAAKIGGLLYLTSTDARSTSGHDPERSLRIYGASARSHPAVHEQGLRLLIGHAAQTAAARGLGIQPVFSLFTGQVHRAMVRLVKRPTLSSHTYGFLGYCHTCGQFQTVDWRNLGRVICPGDHSTEGSTAPTLSGPLWLGDLHHGPTLAAMADLATTWGWSAQVNRLKRMAAEISLPPYYYPLGELGRRGQHDIPNRDHLIAALQTQGYRATVPSCDPQAIKTEAPLSRCLTLARDLR
jgi:tRNA (guanine26-N2/guanine27-N2)-dimethyltransferase